MPFFCSCRQSFLSPIRRDGALHAVQQRRPRFIGENRNPVAVLSAIVAGEQSTTESHQPAGGVHERRRAVALAVHLVQPARLEARGHQEDIRARFDLVRQAFVVADLHGDPCPAALRASC